MSTSDFGDANPLSMQQQGTVDPWMMGEIRSFLEANPPRLTIQRLTGRSLVIAEPEFIPNQENTTSTSFTDLTTPGPEQTKLPAGRYLCWFGAIAKVSNAGDASICSPSVNGGTPDATYVAQTDIDRFHSIMAMQLIVLTGDNNSIRLKYKSSIATNTAGFQARWLATLRFSD